MTDEQILDAAAAIIARRARVLQLSRIQVSVHADGWFAVSKIGPKSVVPAAVYVSTSSFPTLGKAWTKEETR